MTTSPTYKHYQANYSRSNKVETLRDIYKAGRDRGLSFGQDAVNELDEDWYVEQSGNDCFDDTTDMDDLQEERRQKAYECEEGNRGYSPFEFTAKKLNDFGFRGDDGEEDRPFYAEDAWDAYDKGIIKGVEIAIYLDARKTRKA